MPVLKLSKVLRIARVAIMVHGVLLVVLLVEAVGDDVNDAEACSGGNVEERLVSILRQDVTACTVLEEVYMVDDFALVVYVLAL